MKHKIGDKVRIVSNISDHGFKIGEEVEVCKYMARGNGGVGEYIAKSESDYWFLHPSDLEKI